MRPATLALPLLLLGLAVARAAAPEADYIAARDAAIAKIKKVEAKNPSADTTKMDQKALIELERRLQGLIGPLSVKPYPETGKIAFDTLSANSVGSGGLDALRFATADGDQQAYVTTDGLLARWLSKPQAWWTKTRKTPPPIDEALANPEFYTYAIGIDAALTRTAELPIAKTAGTNFASALLGGWAQDVGPIPEQEIIVALRRDGRVYLAKKTARTYKPIPACEALWTEAQRKADQVYKKYTDGGAKDPKVFGQYNRHSGQGGQGLPRLLRRTDAEGGLFSGVGEGGAGDRGSVRGEVTGRRRTAPPLLEAAKAPTCA